MLVQCVCNDIRHVDSESELGKELRGWFGADTYTMNLTMGRLYVVYAVAVHHPWLRYYVADDLYTRTEYPFGYFAAFFKVVDRRPSRCWTLGHQGPDGRSPEVLLACDEWATDPTFYERLVDGLGHEQHVFRERKEFMDLEFPNSSIGYDAEFLGEGWLLCPRCSKAWESQSCEGLVRCPKCKARLSNPLSISRP